jgi:hypothetical protein
MHRRILAILLVTLAPALAAADTPRATIHGWVIDSACLYVKNLDKPVGKDCAIKCAKAGSPLVILADDGTVYLPISGDMPATGQNERLMEFAGDKVTVSGQVFARGGSHAVIIEKIER